RRTPRLTQYLETPSSSTTPPHPSVYASTPSPSVDRIASAGRQIVAPTSRGLSGRMSLRRKYESRPGKQALIGLLPQESRNVVLIHPALAEGLDGGAAILAKHGRRGFHRVFVLVTRPRHVVRPGLLRHHQLRFGGAQRLLLTQARRHH